MKVLLDTNIILDWWLERRPFMDEAQYVLSAAESGQVEGSLCATSVTTLFYLSAKEGGASQGRKAIETLLKFLEIAPVNRAVVTQALESPTRDYEDAVLAFSARESKIDAIVTRDKHGFERSPVRILSCSELIHLLEEGTDRSDE
jgi:predicted nucleic acid-binding protein